MPKLSQEVIAEKKSVIESAAKDLFIKHKIVLTVDHFKKSYLLR